MITLLIVFVVSFFLFIWIERRDYPMLVTSIFGALFLAFITVLVFTIPLLILGKFTPSHYEKVSSVRLVSIRDRNGMSGAFFLGTGRIESEEYCFFYKEKSNGSFSPDKIILDDSVSIFEEERKDAVIDCFQEKFNTKALHWFLFKLPIKRYEIHVPNGTIKRGFEL